MVAKSAKGRRRKRREKIWFFYRNEPSSLSSPLGALGDPLFYFLSATALLAGCAAEPAAEGKPPVLPRGEAPGMHSAVSAETAAVESVAATIDTAAPSSTAPAPGPAAKRIYSVGQTTWIRKTTEVREGEFLGYVRTGSSVPLRSNDRVKGVGCPGGFYQVAPRGYVCADRTVTDNPPAGFAAAAEATRGTTAALPYRYALSDGAPMYNRIPTKKEQERYEPPWLHKPHVFHKLPKTLRSHEELATNDVIEPTDEVPAFLQNGGSAKEGAYDLVEQTIPLGSMLSYTKAFEADGRTWLLSADHTIVPADRVRPFRMSTFRGVDLVATKTKLPIAFMRVGAKPKYRKRGDSIDKTGAQWAVRTSVALSGASIEVGGKKYLEVNENDDGGAQLYIAETDATVIDREPDRPHGVKEKQKWFLIRLSQGTLVAYEDLEPVYATLVSPGRGGLPVKGRDNVQDSTTPTGAFSITFKDRAATMSPEKGKDRTFWISDVPYTQYFNPPFALHAAYWHERFGEFVSAGCVNLSPLDAEALFTWSDPGVPLDWQGATGAGAKENGATTIVVVRR